MHTSYSSSWRAPKTTLGPLSYSWMTAGVPVWVVGGWGVTLHPLTVGRHLADYCQIVI